MFLGYGLLLFFKSFWRTSVFFDYTPSLSAGSMCVTNLFHVALLCTYLFLHMALLPYVVSNIAQPPLLWRFLLSCMSITITLPNVLLSRHNISYHLKPPLARKYEYKNAIQAEKI